MTGKRGERSNKVQALTTFNGESVSFCYLSTVGLLQDREQAILIHVPYRCSNPLRPCYSSGTTGSFACDKARGERGSSIRPEGAEFDRTHRLTGHLGLGLHTYFLSGFRIFILSSNYH